MLKLLIVAITFSLPLTSFGQDIEKDLKRFTRVMASHRINVVLKKGLRESVRIAYKNVDPEKINIVVRGKTLNIFLDDARRVEKTVSKSRGKMGIYEGAEITAYVTYQELENLEIRGNQEIQCLDPIDADVFRLRAYGENRIRLSSLKTSFFNAKLYGQNDLRIRSGRTLEQKYLLYGENRIDTKGMRSDYMITSIFGEGSLRVNSAEEVRIDAFGEPRIFVDGGAQINRRLVFGKADIKRITN